MTQKPIDKYCTLIGMIDFGLFGLTTRDKRVYEGLLTGGVNSIRGIAEHTGINRGSVYESLKALMLTGLVSHVVTGKTTRYTAESPEKLHEIINEQKRRLQGAHGDTDDYIQSLVLDRQEPSAFQFASFYDGDEGLANVLRDVLSTCRLQGVSKYRAISSPRVSEYLYNNFKHFTRERIKQGLHVKVLRQGEAVRGEAELAEWRMAVDYLSDTGCYTIIYGTKVAIVSIDKYNHTTAIIIDNTGVAQTQTKMFDIVWHSL
jgi:sugar-specific transcriptional regulator TrmB